MHAEPRLILVADPTHPWRGPLLPHASAVPEILLASTGAVADCEAASTLRRLVTEFDGRSDADGRSFARSIRDGIDTAVQGHIASGTFASGHSAIAAPTSITSPDRHPSIGLDHLRSTNPAGHPLAGPKPRATNSSR